MARSLTFRPSAKRRFALALAFLILVAGLTSAARQPRPVAASTPTRQVADFNRVDGTAYYQESTASAQPAADSIITVNLATRDLIYDSRTGMIYASVPSSDAVRGNSITPLNPATGALGSSVAVGSEPSKLAISDNGQYIYVALDGAAAVRRFDVASQTAGLQFPVGMDQTNTYTLSAEDMAVMPGSPETVAISRQNTSISPRHKGVAIYDNGVPRPDNTEFYNHNEEIEFSNSPAVLYGMEPGSFSGSFTRMAVGGCGVNPHFVASLQLQSGVTFKYDNGLAYLSAGTVYNPETRTVVGNVSAPGLGFTSLVAPDSQSGRVFYLTGSGAVWTLRAFNIQTLEPTGELEITGVSGTPGSLIRWGAKGLAFRTSGGQVFLIQTSLVPDSPTPPTPAPPPAPTTYQLSGRVGDFGGSRLSGATVTATSQQSTLTAQTDVNGNYVINNLLPCERYTITVTKPYYIITPISVSMTPGRSFFQGNASHVVNFGFSPEPKLIKFSQQSYTVSERVGQLTLTVNRTGDPSAAASAEYTTSDLSARQGRDYLLSSGTLNFAPNETIKQVSIFITDDAYDEQNENFLMVLRNPTGTSNTDPFISTINIEDDDVGAPTTNPIDEARFYVRQHYADFLSREPDPAGLNYWSEQITGNSSNAPPPCPPNTPTCEHIRRISVSAAFFVENEFQRTGGFIVRFYKASYGTNPTFAQFNADRSQVPEDAQLEPNKQAFAAAWVQRPAFTAKYPASLNTGAAFVDAMLQNVMQNSGVDLSSQRNSLINDYNLGGRAQVVRSIADNATFAAAEYNKAFVLMQYFGYLQRDPDAGGYQFWLDILNNRVPNNFRAMVCAFLTSAEYQQRFGPTVTRTNSDCAVVGP